MDDDAEFDTQYSTTADLSTISSQPTGNPNEPYVSVAQTVNNGPVLVKNDYHR